MTCIFRLTGADTAAVRQGPSRMEGLVQHSPQSTVHRYVGKRMQSQKIWMFYLSRVIRMICHPFISFPLVESFS